MSKLEEFRAPTPEEIEAYIRKGRQLRAEAMREMLGLDRKPQEAAMSTAAAQTRAVAGGVRV